jgi:hypothetical protein
MYSNWKPFVHFKCTATEGGSISKSKIVFDLDDIARIFDVKPNTPRRWSYGRGRKLPPADGTVSGAPCWLPETIYAWAKSQGMTVVNKL